MNSSGSWSSELLNEESDILSLPDDYDDNVGLWAIIPFCMICLIIAMCGNHKSCRQRTEGPHHIRP